MKLYNNTKIPGLLVTAVWLPKLELKEEEEGNTNRDAQKKKVTSLCGSLVEVVNTVKDTRMLMLIPVFMAQAMAVGVLQGDYTRVSPKLVLTPTTTLEMPQS